MKRAGEAIMRMSRRIPLRLHSIETAGAQHRMEARVNQSWHAVLYLGGGGVGGCS